MWIQFYSWASGQPAFVQVAIGVIIAGIVLGILYFIALILFNLFIESL